MIRVDGLIVILRPVVMHLSPRCFGTRLIVVLDIHLNRWSGVQARSQQDIMAVSKAT